MTLNKVATIRFWSGCIPAGQVNAWFQQKEQWAQGKLASLCVPPCSYVQLPKRKNVDDDCPPGQRSVRITIRAFCLCPEGHEEYPENSEANSGSGH